MQSIAPLLGDTRLEDLKTALLAIKKDIESYDALLHKIPLNEEFQGTSEAYRSKIIEKAYSLKKKLIDLDTEVLGLLDAI